jgi:hypothetical protein
MQFLQLSCLSERANVGFTSEGSAPAMMQSPAAPASPGNGLRAPRLLSPNRIWCGLVLFAMLAATALAQQAGQIGGTIRDSSGSLIAGAKVTATEVGTSFSLSTKSSGTGDYVLPNLRPTEYVITVTADGFRTFRQTQVRLEANRSLTANVTLEVGVVTEIINVASTASQVDTSTSTLAEVVDSARIAELPLNGRDAARLATLVAGTVLAGVSTESGKTIPGGLFISSNGTSAGQVSFKLDGTNHTDPYFQMNMEFPFPDALQEFSIQTSNYSAVYGNNAGAVVNAVTKSGTNDLHGGAFEFVRNREFNARDFFAPIPDYLKRNQFGVFAGGPVVLPKLYSGHNKTFFFMGWQGTRLRNVNTAQTAFAPTNQELSGNFAGCGSLCSAAIKDPSTGQPFPGNQIAVNRFNPVAIKLINTMLPAAVQPSGTGFVTYQKPVSQNMDQGLIKIDHQFNDKDRFSLRYFIDQYQNTASYNPQNYLSFGDGSGVRSQDAALQEIHIFSPSLVNDLHLSAVRYYVKRGPPEGVPDWVSLGVALKQTVNPPVIQSVGVTGFFTAGDFTQGAFIRNGLEVSDRLSWIHGRHSLSFGASFERQQGIGRNQLGQGGTASFSGSVTGNAMADFFLGSVGTWAQGSGEIKDNLGTFPAFYAQDDIKVNSRFTLNLGLRYEPARPWMETRDRYEKFRTSDFYAGVHSARFPLAPPGETFYGDPGVPYGGTHGDYNNFAPRVGFAWSLTADGKTSLRGGGGTFYDTRGRGDANNTGVSVSPWSPSITLTQPVGGLSNPYLGIGDPFPAGVPSASSIFPRPVTLMTYDERLTSPVNYNWNLTLEKEVAKAWLVRLAYVGTRANHLRRNKNLDPAVYSPGVTTATTDARRLFAPYYGSITLWNDDGESGYHSFQVSLIRRMSHGFTLMSNYTLSKSIDDVGTGLAGNASGVDQVQPFYMPGFNSVLRGPSDFDHKQRLVNSYLWEIPFTKRTTGLVAMVLGGWELNGVQQYQTGSPMTVISGRDNSLTGLNGDRGILTGQSMSRAAGADPVLQWFNQAAFAVNPVGTFGTLGKGILRGPNMFAWDMGMFKKIKVGERVNLQFRTEFFNIFNHANFNNPSASVTSASFGRITQTLANASGTFSGTASPGLNASPGDPLSGGPRIIQFGLKLLF